MPFNITFSNTKTYRYDLLFVGIGKKYDRRRRSSGYDIYHRCISLHHFSIQNYLFYRVQEQKQINSTVSRQLCYYYMLCTNGLIR
jgi:hypothetical protein